MVTCTLSTIESLFSCAQQGLPFSEGIVLVVFFTFFLVFKSYPNREALSPSLFIATLVALLFLGANLINPLVPVIGIILTALSVVFLNNQNNPV